jgi:hypothetical protein
MMITWSAIFIAAATFCSTGMAAPSPSGTRFSAA